MKLPKIIAFYFPQFHPIPENDEWWGKGFTDWKLVKEARPLFDGHNQPRIPIDDNYYNPCEKETLVQQAILAKKYGIEGFMFYHYWFDGKLYLEKPMEVFLENLDINLEFCVTWANESWTRSWVGKPEVFLQKQLHTVNKKKWENHFNYLLPFFKDSRAIRVDEKPVFLIYQPFLIKKSEEMLAFWNDLAIANGLKGLYFIAIKNHDYQSSEFLSSYDAIMKFQPREAYSSIDFQEHNKSARFQILRRLPHKIQLYLSLFNQKISKHKIFDSKNLWNIILKNSYKSEFVNYKLKIFESAFFEWDNTARYKKKAKIFTGLSFEEKKVNFKKLMDEARKNDSPYVFFNAWNEWSESAYLEPDKKHGFKHLEIIKEVTDEFKSKVESKH
jgi:hypothetical protein